MAVRFGTTFDALHSVLDEWFLLERGIRNGTVDADRVAAIPDALLRDFLWMLAARWSAMRADPVGLTRALGAVEDVHLVEAGRRQLRHAE